MPKQHLTAVCLNTGDMEWNSNRISLCESRLHDRVWVCMCVWRYCCRWIIKQSVSGSCNLKRSSSPALPPQLIYHLISTKIRLEKWGTAAFSQYVCARVCGCESHTKACVCVCWNTFPFCLSHTRQTFSPLSYINIITPMFCFIWLSFDRS